MWTGCAFVRDATARLGLVQTRWHTFKRPTELAIKHRRAPHFTDSGRGYQLGIGVSARSQLDTVDGVAYMTWDETSGWTLYNMLGRVRALGIRIPAEYALLVAERIAAALEHAFRAASDGRPTPHGLLWPGFVAISHDAAVRVGGFGVADAVPCRLSAAT